VLNIKDIRHPTMSAVNSTDVYNALHAKGKILPLIESLMTTQDCPVWIHEKQLYNILNVPTSTYFGRYHALSCIIGTIRKGSGGNKRKNNMVTVDDKYYGCQFSISSDSAHRVGYQFFGGSESFNSGSDRSDVKLHPRWFKFGPVSFTCATQKDIVAEAMGDDKAQLDSVVAERRRAQYKDFFSGAAAANGYANVDIPMMALTFKDQLSSILTRVYNEHIVEGDNGVIVSVGRRAFDLSELSHFEYLVRLMLAASNEFGRLRISNNQYIVQMPSKSTRALSVASTQRPLPARDLQITPPPILTSGIDSSRQRQSRNNRRYSSAPTGSRNSIPDSLLLDSLGKHFFFTHTMH
jgi:hypothetical protein